MLFFDKYFVLAKAEWLIFLNIIAQDLDKHAK